MCTTPEPSVTFLLSDDFQVQYWDDDVEDIVDIKDGEVPLPDMINPWEQIKNGRMTAVLQSGKWRVRSGHTPIYVSSYTDICVLILPCIS